MNDDPSWAVCNWLRAKLLAEWFVDEGIWNVEVNAAFPNFQRAIYRWRFEDEMVSFGTADHWLTKRGRHISEIPEHIWYPVGTTIGPKLHHRYDVEEKERVVALVKIDGLSIPEAVKQTGATDRAVRKWLRTASLHPGAK